MCNVASSNSSVGVFESVFIEIFSSENNKKCCINIDAASFKASFGVIEPSVVTSIVSFS